VKDVRRAALGTAIVKTTSALETAIVETAIALETAIVCGDGDCEDDERLELDDILPACKSVDLAHQIAWQSVP
jgi:hypothetical protein